MTKETEVQAAAEPNLREKDREIVEDVVMDPPAPEEPGPDPDDPRAAIYARHQEKRETELEGSFPDENTEIGAKNTESGVESDDSGAIIDPEPARTDTPSDSEMVTVKILGDYRKVPKDKVDALGGIENYQIRIAAQEQMERNAHDRQAQERRQQALDERERRLAEREAAIPNPDSQQAAPNPDRSTPSDGQNLETMARQTLEAVYDDADEAPQRLVQTVEAAVQQAVAKAGRQGAAVDTDALRRQIRDDILAEQRQAKIVTASHALIEGHAELQQRSEKYDPRLFDMVDSETVRLEDLHPDWDPQRIVQQAYENISSWRGDRQPQTMSEKQAQKRAMNRPRVGTARSTPPPEPPRPTASDYVTEQKRLRGQEV